MIMRIILWPLFELLSSLVRKARISIDQIHTASASVMRFCCCSYFIRARAIIQDLLWPRNSLNLSIGFFSFLTSDLDPCWPPEAVGCANRNVKKYLNRFFSFSFYWSPFLYICLSIWSPIYLSIWSSIVSSKYIFILLWFVTRIFLSVVSKCMDLVSLPVYTKPICTLCLYIYIVSVHICKPVYIYLTVDMSISIRVFVCLPVHLSISYLLLIYLPTYYFFLFFHTSIHRTYLIL